MSVKYCWTNIAGLLHPTSPFCVRSTNVNKARHNCGEPCSHLKRDLATIVARLERGLLAKPSGGVKPQVQSMFHRFRAWTTPSCSLESVTKSASARTSGAAFSMATPMAASFSIDRSL